MDFGPLTPVILLGLGVLALTIVLGWMQRRGWVDFRKDKVRRGVGHMLLGAQEFLQPSVEHVFEAENVEPKEEDDLDPEVGDVEAIKGDLASSLGRSPVDPEEVRRHLAAASRSGLDWRGVYDEAVRLELAARPFRAPYLPPSWRVAPRG